MIDFATQLRHHRVQMETKLEDAAGEQGVQIPAYLLLRTIKLLKAAESGACAQHMLGELLAVIHRDGGQYQDAVGVDKAWTEAMTLSVKRLEAC